MLLESDSPKEEAKAYRMAKDVYKSCMDKESIEALGIEPIKDILKQFGGWPGRHIQLTSMRM
jgi:predicted metalloendopeptidase